MERMWGLDLDTALAMVAILLGLSIAAQVLQEIYKYVTASKSRMYKMALRDFLGPRVKRLYKRPESKPDDPAPTEDLFVRGPFQFGWGDKRKARLLPLEKQNLLIALELTASEWTRKTIAALKAEAELQKGQPAPPSPILRRLIDDAWKDHLKDDDGPWKTFDFFERWGAAKPPPPAEAGREPAATEHTGAPSVASDGEAEGRQDAETEVDEAEADEADEVEADEADEADDDEAAGAGEEPPPLEPTTHEPVDAARLLRGYYEEFLRERAKVEKRFEQFAQNFDYSYNRRNLRQTLLLALVLTVGLNLPFTELYRQAKSLTPEEATALVDSLVELQASLPQTGQEPAPEAGGDQQGDPDAAADSREPDTEGEGEGEEETGEGGAGGAESEDQQPAAGSDGGEDGGGSDTGQAPAGSAPGEAEELQDLLEELRAPLEAYLELDRKREERQLEELMSQLGKPLKTFAGLRESERQPRRTDLDAALREPLEGFVERCCKEADPAATAARLLAACRGPLDDLAATTDPGEQALETAKVALRKSAEEYLDERSDRGRFFSRGVRQLAKLWREDRGAIPAFLGNCLATALLISFGAPFWDRLSRALLGIRKGTRGAADGAEGG